MGPANPKTSELEFADEAAMGVTYMVRSFAKCLGAQRWYPHVKHVYDKSCRLREQQQESPGVKPMDALCATVLDQNYLQY